MHVILSDILPFQVTLYILKVTIYKMLSDGRVEFNNSQHGSNLGRFANDRIAGHLDLFLP